MSVFAENIELPVAYLKTVSLLNVRSFKGENEIFLSDKDGRPAQWTVILGNNNTGKTTILKCIADLYLRTEKVDNNKINIHNLDYERTDEEYYAINISKRPLNLFTQKKGEYNIETNVLGEFSPTFIDKKSNQDLTKIANWGIAINKKEVLGILGHPHFRKVFLQGYSTQRKTSESSISEQDNIETLESFFSNNFELINVEEWLLQIHFATNNSKSSKVERERAKEIEKKVSEIIKGDILPDIKSHRFISTYNFKNYIEFQTDYGWVRLKDLGYGYQATLAWVMDLAKRMFDRYPTSANPLAEPAVVLVDEIDLHLHPEWQRKIISYLSNIFKNTQFIVTAHSPLIVQSAENVNLVMLEKDGDHINIRQQFGSFKGWTVDEILTELMGMDDKTMSDTYLNLMKQFDKALDEDNYEKAHLAYEGLDKILHPSSSQRKILRIQMSSLAPVEA